MRVLLACTLVFLDLLQIKYINSYLFLNDKKINDNNFYSGTNITGSVFHKVPAYNINIQRIWTVCIIYILIHTCTYFLYTNTYMYIFTYGTYAYDIHKYTDD